MAATENALERGSACSGHIILDQSTFPLEIYVEHPHQGILKGGSITVLLTSCLTGLDWSLLQIKTKIVSSHTADSKPIKQEVNSTLILSPLVFPAIMSVTDKCIADMQSLLELKTRPRFCHVNWSLSKERTSSVLLQVLCGQPEPGNLFGFCADYLEGRLEQRDKADPAELSKKKRFATKKEKEETEKTTRDQFHKTFYCRDLGLSLSSLPNDCGWDQTLD